MKQAENQSQSKNKPGFFIENVHWIATILLVLGFIIMAINNEEKFGRSFHQVTLAPILLLAGYGLFIVVVMKKIKD